MRSLYRTCQLMSAGAVASVVLLGIAAKAPAETIEWSGTFQLIISDFPADAFLGTGTGVSTVSTSDGSNRIGSNWTRVSSTTAPWWGGRPASQGVAIPLENWRIQCRIDYA